MGIRVVVLGDGGDPYAPKAVVHRHRLPAGRLRRLGASEELLGVYQEWWETLGRPELATEWLAGMTDGALAQQIQGLDQVGMLSPKATLEWVAGHDPGGARYVAAGLAVALEGRRDKPRTSVASQLSLTYDPEGYPGAS